MYYIRAMYYTKKKKKETSTIYKRQRALVKVLSYSWVNTNRLQSDKMMRKQNKQWSLTSLSRPAATVTISPVSLLMVNMLGMGLWGVCERMR